MKLAKDIYLVGSGNVGISNVTDCNVYLIDGHDEMALIDTGSGVTVERILENIREDGLDVEKIKYILLTHSHNDHCRGVPFFRKCTKCKVGVHPGGVEELERGTPPEHPLAKAGFAGKPVHADFTFSDGQIIKVGAHKLKVMASPGHSTDSVCFLGDIGGLRVAFSGDTLLGEGRLGGTDASTNFLVYRDSLDKLLAESPDALLPGHGLFCVKNAREYIGYAAGLLRQRWSGIMPVGTSFFPSWWATKYGEKVLEY